MALGKGHCSKPNKYMNNRNRLYGVLVNTWALLEKTYHLHPIIYGSLGVELALEHDYDVHDIDLIIPDSHFDETKLAALFVNQGYEIIARSYFTVRKNDIDVEISRLSYWENVARFCNVKPIALTYENTILHVLDIPNLLRLYEYLLTEPSRGGFKNERDEVKVKHLRAKMMGTAFQGTPL